MRINHLGVEYYARAAKGTYLGATADLTVLFPTRPVAWKLGTLEYQTNPNNASAVELKTVSIRNVIVLPKAALDPGAKEAALDNYLATLASPVGEITVQSTDGPATFTLA